ncbi:Uma2 family endonuclease [Cohnella rhizosphaerae]|uniref:Uma2 family endonuclease n=1 Tax=Cohnella rhizosphaerae TaxID=1457232 RepID=A0A9X4KSA2_9BACL|nr:Uma2 family endonuclease [Cohnella rhizosphaerae]MDG0809930.1 Uma2 family endonuclease [Cohnella rhizosphaerae]
MARRTWSSRFCPTARRVTTRRSKKGTYERFGVAEYWLVEPEYRLVDQFVLTEGEYRLVKTWTVEDEIVSSAVPCLAVNLAEVFRRTV